MSEIILTVEIDENGNLVLVHPETKLWIALIEDDKNYLLNLMEEAKYIVHECWGEVAKKIRRS